MVRRAYDRSFNAAMMEDFDDSEVIRASELRDHPDFADWKLLRGGYSRLVQTSAQHSELLESMATAIREVQHSVSQLSKQLGQHPIDAEFSQHVLPTTDEHTEKFDSMEALLRELKQAPSIEMPEFDASNVSDWLSKVEQSFRVRRFSDLDKLDLVAFSLEGYVLQWFSWEMSHNEFRSWDEFRRRLLLKFGAAPEKSSENVAEILEERASYSEKKGTVSASVTESAELSSQVVGLDDSHLEQIFDTGLQTEMKEVLQLKESMELENQKPAVLRMEPSSFCQLFCEETFTSTPVASVNSLCFAVDTVEHMSSGLSQSSHVWEPGGVLVDISADLMAWLVQCYTGFEFSRLCVGLGLLVFPWNLMLLEFFLFIHLEDKGCLSGASNSWCGWMVFDRGKNSIISGAVTTLVFLDLKKCFCHEAEKRGVQTMLLVKAKDTHVDSLTGRIKIILSCGVIALRKQIQWAEIQKLSLYKELWIEIMDGDSTKLLNSTGGKHTISALELYLSSVFSTVTSANSGWLQTLLEQVLQGSDEALLEQVLQGDDDDLCISY